MWRLLLIALLLVQPACGVETLEDTWRVTYYEPDEALPVTMTWAFYCDMDLIREAAHNKVLPTAYNLFDNINACYIHIEEIDEYIDTHERLKGVARLLTDANHTLMLYSNEQKKHYRIPPIQLKYLHLTLEGVLYSVVGQSLTPSKKVSV